MRAGLTAMIPAFPRPFSCVMRQVEFGEFVGRAFLIFTRKKRQIGRSRRFFSRGAVLEFPASPNCGKNVPKISYKLIDGENPDSHGLWYVRGMTTSCSGQQPVHNW
jgi:hypothetical protein